MNIDTTHIQNEIAALENKTYNISLEESAAAGRRVKAIYEMMDDADFKFTSELKEEFRALADKIERINDFDYLRNLRHTMNSALMKVTKKYVVTNTEHLISPAGFSPSTNVFHQTAIAIHTDDLSKIPASNVKLYAHKRQEG